MELAIVSIVIVTLGTISLYFVVCRHKKTKPTIN